jgi:sugar transferase (PEP-CTERM/EpsH1 system associated)
MEALLFLAHRMPYPPNKGDKVRSHAFLAHLAARYRVFLGTFMDEPSDRQHLATLKDLCAGVQVESIQPALNRAASLRGLFSGEALSVPYFRSRRLAAWTRLVVQRERITRAFVFSSPMAQYVMDMPSLRRVVDFVDLDSQKWADYAAHHRWPAAAVYRREAQRLLRYEKAVAARAHTSLFVTAEEAQRFVAQAPEHAERVQTIGNGVDAAFFSPAREFQSPFRPNERALVFTGAMDYWPNIDGVVWFAREVLPILRRIDPRIRFYVVGMNPDGAVRALAQDPATVVTGRVPDVRPYLQHASVVVAPLRVARGIQNKVLEAMAMAKPVVATMASAKALGARAGEEFEAASDAAAFAAKVRALIGTQRGESMGRMARARVVRDYTWAESFERLDALLEGAPQPLEAQAG